MVSIGEETIQGIATQSLLRVSQYTTNGNPGSG